MRCYQCDYERNVAALGPDANDIGPFWTHLTIRIRRLDGVIDDEILPWPVRLGIANYELGPWITRDGALPCGHETFLVDARKYMAVFNDAQLKKIVAETLPNDAMNGTKVVVGAVDQHGAQVVASFKQLNGHWELQAAARHDWDGTNTVGAKVLLRW